MSAPVVEETTGYKSFLICEHKDIIVFYRTGREVAIYQKAAKTLVVTSKHGEDLTEIWSALQKGANLFGMEIANRDAASRETESQAPMKVKVHRVELLVIDHDDIGAEGVKSEIENTKYSNRCISPDVKSIETREVEWDDNHPLNNHSTADAEYRRLFATPHGK